MTYNENELREEHIKSIEDRNKKINSGIDRRVVTLEQLGDQSRGDMQQRTVVECFLKKCGLWKNREGIFDSHEERNLHCPNVLFCPGPAGTGKSFVIDCLVHEIESRGKEKYALNNDECKVLVLGPTGKSALAVGGHTINSNQGLSVPIRDLDNVSKHSLRDGTALLRLQHNLRYVEAIIVDEYSMISSRQLYWMNRRLKEGKKTNRFKDSTWSNDMPFNGIPILFMGNPGQLPPVGGSSMWLEKTTSGRTLSTVAREGYELYRTMSKSVLFLTEVRRQSGEFKDMLGRLRNGCNSREDWRLLNDTCGSKIDENNKEDTTIILTTNEAVRKKNIEMLRKLRLDGNHVLQILAEHDSKSTSTYSSEYCRRLQSKLYLAVGAKVMLQWNLAVNAGLVNGSMGVIRDFVYCIDADSPSYIIIEFEDFKGVPYFSCEEKKNGYL